MIFIIMIECIIGLILSIVCLFIVAKKEVEDSSKYKHKKYASEYNNCFMTAFLSIIGLIYSINNL